MGSGRWQIGSPVRIVTTCDAFWRSHRRGRFRPQPIGSARNTRPVARHIQALEDELNNRLFDKSNSGYGLTEAGERLVAGAEAIGSAYTFWKAAASGEQQPISGTVVRTCARTRDRSFAQPQTCNGTIDLRFCRQHGRPETIIEGLDG